jgi:hypothetical protein
MRQEAAALRNYNAADVRFGSLAADEYAARGLRMSALPPKADIVWVHCRRHQLSANAAIASARVAA